MSDVGGEGRRPANGDLHAGRAVLREGAEPERGPGGGGTGTGRGRSVTGVRRELAASVPRPNLPVPPG